MKALIKKELRENFKLAMLGFVIFTLALVWVCASYGGWVRWVAGSQGHAYGTNYQDRLQPLVSQLFLVLTAVLCGGFGALLGWMQIFNERHRDLWAFLVHRPITRTQIFWGKVSAGVLLYALAMGLPLVGFITWALMPGHVAAPFEWAMLQPVAGLCLAGLVCYFAGMLTGLRQARWYGSRAWGLAVPILIYCLGLALPDFGTGLIIIFIGGVLLAMAVWGGFHNHGHYSGQPTPARLALTAVLFVGALAIVGGVMVASTAASSGLTRTGSWGYFVTTKEGEVYKVIQSAEVTSMVDLAGRPVVDPKTGRELAVQDLIGSRGTHIQLDLGEPAIPPGYLQSSAFFTLRETGSGALWYYWHRYGRIVGFDAVTRRLIGSIGPDGFVPNSTGAGGRFAKANKRSPWKTVWSDRSVYRIDYPQRAAHHILTTGADEPIGGSAEVWNDQNLVKHLVATRRFAYLVTPEGKVEWRLPFPPADNQVQVYPTTGGFVVWFQPDYWTNQKAGGKQPSHVFWVDPDSRVTKTATVPQIEIPANEDNLAGIVAAVVLPPAVLAALPLMVREVQAESAREEIRKLAVPILLLATIWASIGWWLGGRLHLSMRTRIGWAVFHLLAGLPGLLAFVCVQEWPARETCPHCKKLRLVDREQCEHCGGEFSPPERTGTEIFEPLEPTVRLRQ